MRRLRHVALFGLLGICLAGFTCPRVAWSLAAEPATEQGGESPHELLYRIINFMILAGGLGYVLRKPLADFFNFRSASIQKSLDEGRKALETAQAQLRAVEERLLHLGEEIAAFQAAAENDMEAERQRLRQAAEEESARILESARAQMEMALRGARLELKHFAAEQSVKLAEDLIRGRLDGPARERLVRQFATTLHPREHKN